MMRTKTMLPKVVTREQAAAIANASGHFQSTITFERDGIVLNGKSMIGLLSQSVPKDRIMWLVVDGEDEKAATDKLMATLEGFEG